MKKIMGGIFILLTLAGAGSASYLYWKYHVDVDLSKVDTLVQGYVKSLPEIPSEEQNRVAGLFELGKAFDEQKKQWNEEEKNNFETWSFDTSFFSTDPAKIPAMTVCCMDLLQKFSQVAKRPLGIPPLYAQQKEILPNYDGFKKAAGFFDLALLYVHQLANQKRWEEAWPYFHDLLLLSLDLQSYPDFPSVTVSLGNHKKWVSWLSSTLSAHELSEGEIPMVKTLIGQFNAMGKKSPQMSQILMPDLVLGQRSYRWFLDKMDQNYQGAWILYPAKWYQTLRGSRVSLKQLQCFLSAYESSLNPSDPIQLSDQLKKKTDEEKEPCYSVQNMSDLPMDLVLNQLALQTMQVELALAIYHTQKMDYPSNLDELVTQGYLAEIPKDPFSVQGRSILYKKKEKGYLLYSLGPDQNDDGESNLTPAFEGFATVDGQWKGDLKLALMENKPSTFPFPLRKEAELIDMLRPENEQIKKEIDSSPLQGVLQRSNEWSQQFETIPFSNEGHIVGLKVHVEPDDFTLFSSLGLIEGDVLVAIDDKTFDTGEISALTQVFQGIKNHSRLTFWRNGEWRQYRINIINLE